MGEKFLRKKPMNFAFIVSQMPISGTICIEVFAKLALKNFAFYPVTSAEKLDKNCEINYEKVKEQTALKLSTETKKS